MKGVSKHTHLVIWLRPPVLVALVIKQTDLIVKERTDVLQSQCKEVDGSLYLDNLLAIN